ncbi:hypothetical protein JOC37_001670 [Desulfohalotomaculum tongense]|uniref:anti-sigma factor domain-containing protein n=1 Tax=Desulforadius tongensis TaxID=1216062 RepID=UPI00195953D9|nr:anti-sigma factor domain-containing protein [Desulforadius tongensis]MBM7855277.1 hypothetical protein [Desulforadius tongensis]
MAVVKGMLVQKDGKKGILMTPDGNFVKVVLPDKPVQLGEEIEARIAPVKRPVKTMFLAVAVLVLVLLIPGYHYIFSAQAMAYVTMDINPSIELAVDERMNVIKARGINLDGKKIISEINITGMQLYRALPLLVEQAIKEGYIKSGQNNVILSTVTIAGKEKSPALIEETKVQQAINKPLEDKKINARVLVKQAGEKIRREAEKCGLSAGKYLIYQQAQKQGIKISVEELSSQGISQLEQNKKIQLEKLLQDPAPPGQLKKLKKHLDEKNTQRVPLKANNQLPHFPQNSNDTPEVQEKRVLPEKVKEIKEKNKGSLPPGMDKKLNNSRNDDQNDDQKQEKREEQRMPPGQMKKTERQLQGKQKEIKDNPQPPALKKCKTKAEKNNKK